MSSLPPQLEICSRKLHKPTSKRVLFKGFHNTPVGLLWASRFAQTFSFTSDLCHMRVSRTAWS